MAVRTDIQYVQYYVDGSAAKKTAPKTETKHAATPKTRKVKRKVVVIDPVAVIGVVATVCMLVIMAVGFVRYQNVQEQTNRMNLYIQQLQQQNTELQQTYENGYDLDQIQEIADALGMIPAEDAQQIQVQVQIPQEAPVEEMTLWESFTTFLAGLFA